MKKLAFASLAVVFLGALTTGASALPRAAGISAQNDVVQVKTKKHKKTKKSNSMDENKDNMSPPADEKKGM